MLTVVWSGRRPEDQKAPEGQLWLSCSRSFLGFPSWFLWGPSTLDLIQPLFLSWSENWAGLVDFRAGTKSTPQPAAQCGGDWTVSWPAQGHCWAWEPRGPCSAVLENPTPWPATSGLLDGAPALVSFLQFRRNAWCPLSPPWSKACPSSVI